MLYLETKWLFPKVPQIGDFSCVPATIGMALNAIYNLDALAIQKTLARALGTDRMRPTNFAAAAAAVQRIYHVRAVPLKGWSMSGLCRLAARGIVIIGVSPSILYDVPRSRVGHALILSSSQTPLTADPLAIPSWVPPVTYTDPHRLGPYRRGIVAELIDWAYRAAGGKALWLPSP